MATQHERHANLPIRYNIRLLYITSLIITILVVSASIAGLMNQATFYTTDEMLRSFAPNDVVNLVIGLPVLLGSLWLTWRGRLTGLLLWPGALFYMLYNSLIYVFALPLNVVFLLHLTLVTICVYSLIALVASIDGAAVQQRLSGAVPERLGGAVLAAFGLLFFLQVIGAVINPLRMHTLVTETDLALHIVDFLIVPSWVVGGTLLWRRKKFGYVFGLGLLFQASMLFIGLIAFLLLQPYLTAVPFAMVDVVVVFIFGLVCFIPFALFIRGVISGSKAASDVHQT